MTNSKCDLAMRSDSALEFPPFRLDFVDQQLWRDGELLALRPKPCRAGVLGGCRTPGPPRCYKRR